MKTDIGTYGPWSIERNILYREDIFYTQYHSRHEDRYGKILARLVLRCTGGRHMCLERVLACVFPYYSLGFRV
jgi:hypothetical protein